MEIVLLLIIAGISGFNLWMHLSKGSDKSGLEKAKSEIIEKNLEKLSEMQVKNYKNFAEFKESLTDRTNVHHKGLVDRFNLLSEKLGERIRQFEGDFSKKMKEDFKSLRKEMNDNLEVISGKVDKRLEKGFEKTNETFTNIIARLAKIDEAQKKIESLSQNVVSLQDILTDKKSRGIFGEVQLNQILKSVFGESNDKIYKTQHNISGNGEAALIADAVLFLPEPMGQLAIDSKFPLDNFKKSIDKELPEAQRDAAKKLFRADVKKHINDIASKYIKPGVTSDGAIMFLPAEAIFAEINAYYPQLIQESLEKKVWITSPTTLMAVLTTVQSVMRDTETKEQAGIIQKELMNLSKDFDRYRDRWDTLARDLKKVGKDVDQINISTNKITKSFKRIERVEFEELDVPDPQIRIGE